MYTIETMTEIAASNYVYPNTPLEYVCMLHVWEWITSYLFRCVYDGNMETTTSSRKQRSTSHVDVNLFCTTVAMRSVGHLYSSTNNTSNIHAAMNGHVVARKATCASVSFLSKWRWTAFPTRSECMHIPFRKWLTFHTTKSWIIASVNQTIVRIIVS